MKKILRKKKNANITVMPERFYSPSLKQMDITKVIRTRFWSKNFFNNFWCNIIFDFEHFSH